MSTVTTDSTETTPQTLAEYKAERQAAAAKPAAEPKEAPKGEVATEAKEVKAEPKADDKAAAKDDQAKTGDDAEHDQAEQKKARMQGRFSELAEQRREAERRAEVAEKARQEAERERDELRARIEPKKEELAPAPKPGDFTDAFKYAEALAEWTAKKAVAEDRKAREEAEAKAKADAEREKVQKGWRERLVEAKKETPDWDDVVGSSELAVNDAVRDAIIESEYGPKILYLLADDPKLVEKINGQSILGQLREIGKLEARFDREADEKKAAAEQKDEPVRRQRTPPPEPITPVRGGKVADDPIAADGEFKGSYQDYKAARQRQQRTH